VTAKKNKSKAKQGVEVSSRQYAAGEKVKVAKKTHVIDREREHEGSDPGTLPPVEQDVTGMEGEICGEPYESIPKGGEVCVPIRVANGAIISVPEVRLERAQRTAPRLDGGGQIGASPMAKESYEFWKKHFAEQDKLKRRKSR
jgi:hypothetical protein